MVFQLQKVHKKAKKSANKLQKDQPSFKIRNKVWLLYCNFKTRQPCDKFGYCCLGSFSIITQINLVVFILQLLNSIKALLVFHASFLKLHEESFILGRLQLLLHVKINGIEEHEVEEILDSTFQGQFFNIFYIGKAMTLVNAYGI